MQKNAIFGLKTAKKWRFLLFCYVVLCGIMYHLLPKNVTTKFYLKTKKGQTKSTPFLILKYLVFL